MDLDPLEPESQLVEILHSPQQNSYFEDDLAGDGSVDEDVVMGDTEPEDPDDIFTPLHERTPSSGQIPVLQEETQKDSFRSVVEETQLVAIELETQPIESEQHVDLPSATPPSPKETQKKTLPIAGNCLAKVDIPPPLTLTREPEPQTPGFSFSRPPCRGPSSSVPSDTSRKEVPLVQQRRNIPIDHSLGNVSKKPSPLGGPPLVPVFNNNVAQPSQSKPSATSPNGTDNREMELVPTPAAPIAQPQQGPQLLKSRPKSFKNRFGGPSKKSMAPPFPDVHYNNGKLNEGQGDHPREERRLSVPASAENIRRLQPDSMAASKGNTQQQTYGSHNVSAVELNGQQHNNDCSAEDISGEPGPEIHASKVGSRPIPNAKEQSRHVLKDISNIGTLNVHSNDQSSRHDPSETHAAQSVSQRAPSSSRSVTPSSRPRSRTGQHRAESSHPVNRPVTGQALVPQGVPKQHHTNGSKVSKTYPGQARDKSEAFGSITVGILEKMKVYERSVGPLGHLSTELEERREIIEAQLNNNIKLNDSLREVKSELQSACREKEILEREQKDLSGELDKLQRTCKRYREHMNDVIKCQKALEADSVGLQKKINTLHQEANEGIAAQRANVEAKITELNALLADIKKTRGEETERDKELSDIRTRFEDLTEKNKELNSAITMKDSELKRGRDYIEKLEKQLNGEQLDRHRELIEILKRPQVNHVEELCEEGGMLHRILNTGTSTAEKLEEISTAVNDALKRESEWPGTLRKILEGTSSALQEKLQDSCDKDFAFHESSLKFFDDIKDRLLQIGVDREKNAQLSDRLAELQETTATLKANLDSKNLESEAATTRLKELTEELMDVRAQLANKNDQLMAAVTQPRDDPDAKRKIADLTTEIAKLQEALTTANNNKRQSKQDLQASQELIAATQKQLRETEAKLQTAETDLRQVQSTGRKFQIDCKNAVEKARQDIITITAGEKRDMVIQHDLIVEDLKKKHVETENQLRSALEDLESSKRSNTDQATIISELKSDILDCRHHLQQYLEDMQELDRLAIPPEEISRQTQELSWFRQIFAEHQLAVQDLRDDHPIDIDLIRKDFQERMKEAYGNKKELDRLQKENDQLRRTVADAEKSQQHDGQQARSRTPIDRSKYYSLKAKPSIAPPPPPGERHTRSPPVIHKQSSRKPAARQSSHIQQQHSGEAFTGQNIRQRSKSNNFSVNVASTPSKLGESSHGAQTPGQIKPFSSMSSSSPLTDLESIVDKLDSVHSHAELQQLYKSKSHKLVTHQYGESSTGSQHGSHKNQNLEDSGSTKEDEGRAASESAEEFVTFERKMKGPSHAEESHQRRTARPLRSALKKTTHTGGADVLQEQSNAPSSQNSLAMVRKTTSQSTRKTNAGLSSMSRSGASTYNRIASGNFKGTQESHSEKQAKPDAMLVWEPPPPVGRFKRQRSTSAFAVAARPAKAPRISLGPRTSRTVIPDSQEQM